MPPQPAHVSRTSELPLLGMQPWAPHPHDLAERRDRLGEAHTIAAVEVHDGAGGAACANTSPSTMSSM